MRKLSKEEFVEIMMKAQEKKKRTFVKKLFQNQKKEMFLNNKNFIIILSQLIKT